MERTRDWRHKIYKQVYAQFLFYRWYCHGKLPSFEAFSASFFFCIWYSCVIIQTHHEESINPINTATPLQPKYRFFVSLLTRTHTLLPIFLFHPPDNHVFWRLGHGPGMAIIFKKFTGILVGIFYEPKNL